MRRWYVVFIVMFTCGAQITYGQQGGTAGQTASGRSGLVTLGLGQWHSGLGVAGDIPLTEQLCAVIGGGYIFGEAEIEGETISVSGFGAEIGAKMFVTPPQQNGLGGLWIGGGYGAVAVQKEKVRLTTGSMTFTEEEQQTFWGPFALIGVDRPFGERMVFTVAIGMIFKKEFVFFEGTAYEVEKKITPITLDLGIGVRLD